MKGISIFKNYRQPSVLIEEGYFTILLIKKGYLKFWLEDKEIKVIQGNLFIHTPGMILKMFDSSEDCQVMGLKYSLDYLKEIKTLNDFHKTFASFEYQYIPKWDLTKDEQEIITYLIQKLKQREESQREHLFVHQLFNLTFTELILELIDIGSKQDQAVFHNYNRAEYLALQFLILARDSYKEQIKLEYYADQLAVSIKYLSETLKSITGKTAKEILLELRIGQAKLLLSTSDLDITEIAYELSYDSVSSFSRSFKQIEGISPKEYRGFYL